MNEPRAIAPSEPILRLQQVNTFYGPIQVHFDLSLAVGCGQIVCLLGGNASGKSTTMKIILGLVQPRSGTIEFDGRAIAGLRTPQIIRRGLGSVPEARRLFGGMTVREVAKIMRRYYEEVGLWGQPGWGLGYELGLSLPPDWVGEFYFNIRDDNPLLLDRVIEENMVTNYESMFNTWLVDTCVYTKTGAPFLSKTPLEL